MYKMSDRMNKQINSQLQKRQELKDKIIKQFDMLIKTKRYFNHQKYLNFSNMGYIINFVIVSLFYFVISLTINFVLN
jgi:hypothetical protein